MKKTLLFIYTFVMVVIILICLYIQDMYSVDSVKFTIKSVDNVSQSIGLYSTENKSFVFLPSYADLSTMSINYNQGLLYLDGKHCNSESSFSNIVMNREYLLEIKNYFGIPIHKTNLIFMKAENIPSISIAFVDGTLDDINSDKSVSKSGYIKIINSDGTIDYIGNFKNMHGRGNSTWSEEKKSYALEFSEEISLLDMKKGRGWVLLSNSYDESSLRNKLAFDTAKEINVPYAVNSQHVDLYVNDQYYGLYLLSERVEVGENRVNIRNLSESTQKQNYKPLSNYSSFEILEDEKIKRGITAPNNPVDISGGYLLQIEHHTDRIIYKESLVQTEDLSFSVSSPKYTTQAQTNYLFDYLNSVENNLRNNDLSDIDIDSFVKYYLIQELFANTDNCSFYLYKDTDQIDPKLHACSIWDFDLSMGNRWLVSDMNPKVLYRNYDNWYDYMYNNDEFKTLLTEYFSNEINSRVNDIIYKKLKYYENMIGKSFSMDKIRWCNNNAITDADKSQKRFDTLSEHVNYIENFLNQRVDFLTSLWIDNDEYFYIEFSTSENTKFIKKYSVKKGDVFNENPNPESNDTEGYQFVGWYNEEGDEYIPNRVLTCNEQYYAKWVANTSCDQEDKRDSIKTKPSLIESVKSILTMEELCIIFGLGFIVCFLVFFVVKDLKTNNRLRRQKDE